MIKNFSIAIRFYCFTFYLPMNPLQLNSQATSDQSSLVDTLAQLSQDEITQGNVQEKFQAFLGVLPQYRLTSDEEQESARIIIGNFENFASGLEAPLELSGLTINPEAVENRNNRAFVLQLLGVLLHMQTEPGNVKGVNNVMTQILQSVPFHDLTEQESNIAAAMIKDFRAFALDQDSPMELLAPIQEQMQALFAQTMENPATQIVAFQAAHTILEMHIQNKDVRGAYEALNNILPFLGSLLPSLLQSGDSQGIWNVANMIERFRIFISGQESQINPDLFAAIQEQMKALFAQTKDNPKTQIVAFQAARTILEMHIRNKNVAGAYEALNSFLSTLLGLERGRGIGVAAAMIKNFRTFISGQESQIDPSLLAPIQERMQALFAQTMENPATQIVAFQAACTILEMHIQSKDAKRVVEALNSFLSPLLESGSDRGIRDAAEMIEHLRERIPSLTEDQRSSIQEQMQALFDQTKDNPKTQIVAFQALHTLIRCNPEGLSDVAGRIPEAAIYPTLLHFVHYIFNTQSPDKLIIPFLQCLIHQRVPSNDKNTSLPPHLHDIQKSLEGEGICTIILNQSSVKAPPGAGFYLEAQSNPGQVGTCGLHALRHYVGTQWISLVQLDSIKFQAPASQAALATAIENISQTLSSITIPDETPSGEPTKLKQEILAKISQLTPAAGGTMPDPELVASIVLQTKSFASSLTDNYSESFNFDTPVVATLAEAAQTIEKDVLSVYAGGVDGDVLLAALNPLDDATKGHLLGTWD
jgi:predicted transport protein